MIHAVNSAMLELQGAVLARALYPPGHPRIQQGEQRAHELLARALGSRSEINIFAVGERVVFEDVALPSSPTLAGSLFGAMREKGFDRLTFRAGVTVEEIRRFLDRVTAPGDEVADLASPHVSCGAIVADPLVAASSEFPVLAAEQPVSSISGVWRDILDSRNLDGKTLGDVVSILSRTVRQSSGALTPLASVKAYDEYTFVHVINVAILSISLGEALGFPSKLTHGLGVSGLLHDIGKMVLPVEILNKQARFTEEEFRIMQRHPVEGARILLKTHGVPDQAAIVAYEHHIHHDRSGYPRVPRNWKLNLASRICQVADVFDALRTDRPYRPALPLDKIAKIMKGDAGSHFDPELLDVFFEHVIPTSLISQSRRETAASGDVAAGNTDDTPVAAGSANETTTA